MIGGIKTSNSAYFLSRPNRAIRGEMGGTGGISSCCRGTFSCYPLAGPERERKRGDRDKKSLIPLYGLIGRSKEDYVGRTEKNRKEEPRQNCS